MSYTTIDKPTDYFETKLHNGTGSSKTLAYDFQVDFFWTKKRNDAYGAYIYDSVRGNNKRLQVSQTNAENTAGNTISFGNSSGITIGSDSGNYGVNQSLTDGGSAATYVGWGWLAGGSAPALTYSVKVVSDSGNKYRFDDYGTSAVTLDLQEGGTYTFDQSDSSNSGHPLRFSTTSDGTHGGGSEYTTNVTTTGTPGSAGAKTVITVGSGVATLYYYCTQHSGMGGQANTNSTFGSSNFGGSIQSTVSANTTSGFSIVSWTGNGSASTIGHGLGQTPSMIILKNRSVVEGWVVYHVGADATAPQNKYLFLNQSNAVADLNVWNDTAPTSNVFSVFGYAGTNGSGNNMIAYCFAEKKGYSKIGSYTGNGNADGTFIYTGFKPAFVIYKRTDSTGSWLLYDNKRNTFNVVNSGLAPDLSNAEDVTTNDEHDFLSNGIKMRNTGGTPNGSGGTYIYMAFAESPFVTSGGIPTTAR